MNKKRFIVAIIAALIWLPGAAFCQAADGKIIAIENGVLFGYNINTAGVGVADEISIHLTVADNAQTGFAFVAGDGTNFPDFTLFKLQYFLNPDLGKFLIFLHKNAYIELDIYIWCVIMRYRRNQYGARDSVG